MLVPGAADILATLQSLRLNFSQIVSAPWNPAFHQEGFLLPDSGCVAAWGQRPSDGPVLKGVLGVSSIHLQQVVGGSE